MGVGMNADGRQFQLAGKRPAIERFDIHQLMPKLIRPGIDLAVGQRVEHERIVRVRTMPDADELFGRSGRHGESPLRTRS